MKMVFLFLLVQLLIGCTTKHKLLRKNQEHAEKTTTTKTDGETFRKNTTALYYIDSAHYKQWLKIYPKGRVSIGRNGFVGAADSLIWLNNVTSYQKKNVAQEQQVLQSMSKSTAASSAYSKSAYVKEKQKVALSFWPIALLAGLVCTFIYWRGRSLK
ncbi:MAG: hypothetical protein EOP54_14775 [Sphingobacteriales bacterium]|nr:MAG: hypothetical protein EOP54_14775 [Sphingobacteriales bacterium]